MAERENAHGSGATIRRSHPDEDREDGKTDSDPHEGGGSSSCGGARGWLGGEAEGEREN